MKTLLLTPLLIASVLASPSPGPVATTGLPTPQSALTRILTAPHVSPDWFDTTFLATVPTAKLDGILAEVRSQLGSFTRLEPAGNGAFLAQFSKGTILCDIALDDDGLISGLFFHPPAIRPLDLNDALAKMRAPSGASSYVVMRNGSEIAAFDQGQALTVGSTFKLSVLAALQDAIARGHLHWNDVVALQARRKSYPSGILQSWPDGTPLTVATLATLMISISDNTAADTLISTVGRSAIARYAYANMPFLSTHDLFVLKSNGASALRAAWRTGSTAERVRLIAKLDAMALPSLTELDTSPAYSDIEWHYTNRELCGLMARVQSLPLMAVNPQIADAAAWRRVAYKGGSEGGVLSMTVWLASKSGGTYCVSATWNSMTHPIDEIAFMSAFNGVVSILAATP